MKADARRAAIEERVRTDREVDFATLADRFSVSEMTIRRDIDALEEKGVLRRVAGGAIAFTGRGYEPSFESRALKAATEKQHIAEVVAGLLRPRETVVLDSGSSALAVAHAVRGRGLGLTVVTPSVLVALALVDEDATTVLLTGGKVRRGELSLIGPEMEASFAGYNCDTYVMGIAGLDAAKGATDYHREEAAIKRSAQASSARVIVPIDASKLGQVHLVHVAPLSALDVIVSDGDAADPTLEAAAASGIEVIRVSPRASEGGEQ